MAALNFSVDYDPVVFEPVGAEAGAAALGASKQVTGNAAEPGRYIVVMMGVNQHTVSDGTVARVALRKIGDAADNVTRVTVSDTTLATLDGAELPSEGGTRGIRFDDPDHEQPPRDDPVEDAAESEEAQVEVESEGLGRFAGGVALGPGQDRQRGDAPTPDDTARTTGSPTGDADESAAPGDRSEDMSRRIDPLGVDVPEGDMQRTAQATGPDAGSEGIGTMTAQADTTEDAVADEAARATGVVYEDEESAGESPGRGWTRRAMVLAVVLLAMGFGLLLRRRARL